MGCSLISGTLLAREALARRLGFNAYREQLQLARVAGCYLGILLDQPLAEVAPESRAVLVVAPTALPHEQVPQPDGQVLCDRVSGYPDPRNC